MDTRGDQEIAEGAETKTGLWPDYLYEDPRVAYQVPSFAARLYLPELRRRETVARVAGINVP
jgi:hypothetical protein